jgi:Tol biopolymer transport system component/L-ascorbate metabolism protein UlaG (beta-lactamase superfamily)
MNFNLRKLSIVGGAAILAVIGTFGPGRASSPSGPSVRVAAGADHPVLFYSGRTGNKDVYILHPGEKEPRNLTNHPAQDLCPAASPDGTRVLFLSDRDGNMDIFSMAPDGSGVRNLTSSPDKEEHPEFTPDGKRVLFVRDFDERTEIWIMNADGSEARRLTHNEARDEWPFLSPDGSKVVFMSNRDGNYEIYTMAPDGNGQTRLTNTPELEIFPVWSPDGTKIAYAQKFRADGRMQGMVRVMNADGSGDRAVTAVETRDENPMWSPDGRHIVCQSIRDGNFEVYQVDLDGGGAVRLTDHPAWDGWPCYLPAPARELKLAYVANMGVLVASGETKVLIDALFERPNPDYRAPAPETLAKLMKGEPPFDGIDLVLITHNHPDHLDPGLAVRYLETFPEPLLLAPADAAEAIRQAAAADWPKIGPRVTAVDLKVGDKRSLTLKGVAVTACRTLHSGDRDVPMNLMYILEIDGRRVWHEGDPNGRCDVFQAFGLEDRRFDLAVVHYWYPLEPNCARFLQVDLKVDHIALGHLPIRLEGDAPGKIDLVRQYYKDIFLLLPGMPDKAFQELATTPAGGFFGRTPPGVEPAKFWPEVLAAEACPHGQLAFSPDGTGVFWSAIRLDGREQTIYFSAFREGTFTKPVVAPFAAPAGNGGPAFSPDGKRLYFSAELAATDGSSPKPTAICYVERTGAGWSKPTPIEPTIDNTMTKGQVSVARSGSIYFSGRVLTERTPAIYICRYADGRYAPPEKLRGPLTEAALLIDPWIDPDEKFLLVSCAPPEGPPTLTDIGVSARQADGTWGKPARLGPAVNTEAFERFPSLSRDGRYLFFIRSLSPQFVGDQAYFYWADVGVLGGLKPEGLR